MDVVVIGVVGLIVGGFIAGLVVAIVWYEVSSPEEPKPTPDIVSQTEALELMESLDSKCAEIIRLQNEEKVAVAELVGRMDVYEKKQAEMDNADIALMEYHDSLLNRIQNLEAAMLEDDPDDSIFEEDWPDSDIDEDDSDFDSWLDEDHETDSGFDSWLDEEEEECVDVSPQPKLTDPAETFLVTVDGPLPTSFPITVSSVDWKQYVKRSGDEDGTKV